MRCLRPMPGRQSVAPLLLDQGNHHSFRKRFRFPFLLPQVLIWWGGNMAVSNPLRRRSRFVWILLPELRLVCMQRLRIPPPLYCRCLIPRSCLAGSAPHPLRGGILIIWLPGTPITTTTNPVTESPIRFQLRMLLINITSRVSGLPMASMRTLLTAIVVLLWRE